jgi:chemosensory pili system protein ChpA (sensor histidine kinase/response regulator)
VAVSLPEVASVELPDVVESLSSVPELSVDESVDDLVPELPADDAIDLALPAEELAEPELALDAELALDGGATLDDELTLGGELTLDDVPTLEDDFAAVPAFAENELSDVLPDAEFSLDDELIVAPLDDEPQPAEDELIDMVDALPRVDGVETQEFSDDSFSTDAPLLADDFSMELGNEPTLDVPMTAAQERKHSFVDEEVALVDDDVLADAAMMATDEPNLHDTEEDYALPQLEDALLDDAALADSMPDTDQVDERDLSARDDDALVDTELDAVTDDVGNMVTEDDVADAAAVAEAVIAATPAPAPAAAVPPAAADGSDAEEASVDEEIVEIFVEEIGEVMSHLDEYFPQWVANQQDESALKEFRRGFHTLKGSGRMVGAKYVGELAWSIENMLNRVIDKTIEPTPVLVDLIKTVMGIVPEMVEAFAQRRKAPYVVETLAECANAFARGEKPAQVPPLQLRGAPPVALVPLAAAEEIPALMEEIPALSEDPAHFDIPEAAEVTAFAEPENADIWAADLPVADVAGDDALPLGDLAELTTEEFTGSSLLDADSEDLLPEAFTGEELVEEDFATTENASDTLPVSHEAESPLPMATLDSEPEAAIAEFDPVLIEVFSTESEQHLTAVEGWLAGLDADLQHHVITDELLRALHTLKGSARMAGVMPVAEIAGPTEKFCKELRNNGEMADTDVVALVREAASLIRLRVEHLLPDPYAPIPGAQSYLEMLDAIQSAFAAARASAELQARPLACAVQPRPGLINDLLAEGLDHVLDGGDYAATWSQQGVVASDLQEMRSELRRLAVAADRAGIAPMADVAQRLRRIYNGIDDGQVMLASQVLAALQQGHEAIIAMMDCMAAHQSIWPATEAEVALDEVSAGLPPIDVAELPAEAANRDVHTFSADEMFSEADMAEAEAEVMEKTGTLEPDEEFADVELSADDLTLSADEVIAETGTVEPLEPVEPEIVASDVVEFVEEIPAVVAAEVAPELPAVEAVDVTADAGDDVEFVDEDMLALAAEAERTEVDAPVIAMQEPTHPMAPQQYAAPAPAAFDAGDDEDFSPDRDPELVEIFLEEAAEIVESSGNSLETWLSDVNNTIEVQKLQRDLHTLKGGARMAEIPQLGDLAHELENLYEGLSHGTLSAQPALFRLAQPLPRPHRRHGRGHSQRVAAARKATTSSS